MNPKSAVLKHIFPNFTLEGVLLFLTISVFLFSEDPSNALIVPMIYVIFIFLPFRLSIILCALKCAARLEEGQLLQQAANELSTGYSRRFLNDKVTLTESFVFCKGSGIAVHCQDVKWMYLHTFTQSVLFIPISRHHSLMLGTQFFKPRVAAKLSGRKMDDQFTSAVTEIYSRNPNCLLGFTKETQAQYDSLYRQQRSY